MSRIDTSHAAADRFIRSETEFITDALRAEAEAIHSLVERVRRHEAGNWRAAVDLLAKCTGHVVVAGMGKSGLIGSKISATFTSLGQPSSVLHPAEAVHGDLGRVRRGDVVLLRSYSGNTDEVVNLAAILQADQVPRLSVSTIPDQNATGLTRRAEAGLTRRLRAASMSPAGDESDVATSGRMTP